jgi:alpha-1,2-mannosyltransferase
VLRAPAAVGERTVRTARHTNAWYGKTIELLLLAVAPLVLALTVLQQVVERRSYKEDGWFYDVHTMWVAWQHVVHGTSPYPFVYPAPAAVLPAPIGFLGYRPAVIVFSLILVAAVVLTLRVLGVRDWRCYGAAFLSMMVVSSIEIGTPTPLLALAAACAWRYRDRRIVVAAALAFAIGFKIFLWPLLAWLVVTRRFRAAAYSIAATVALVVGSWAIIGFSGFLAYPRHLNGIATIESYKSYSVVALAHALGLGPVASQIAGGLGILAGLGLVAAVGRGRRADANAFIAALAATFLATPIVWAHYFLLLFVAIAVGRRRFGMLWLAPLAFWALPGQESHQSPLIVLLGLALAFAIAAQSARTRKPSGVAPAAAPQPA